MSQTDVTLGESFANTNSDGNAACDFFADPSYVDTVNVDGRIRFSQDFTSTPQELLRVRVTLATAIPEDVCRAANLGYLDPALDAELRWEESRPGAVYPHLYRALAVDEVVTAAIETVRPAIAALGATLVVGFGCRGSAQEDAAFAGVQARGEAAMGVDQYTSTQSLHGAITM